MCGISGITNKRRDSGDLGQQIARMAHAISYRGPDGLGHRLAGDCRHPLSGGLGGRRMPWDDRGKIVGL